jgi:hypothetical protein
VDELRGRFDVVFNHHLGVQPAMLEHLWVHQLSAIPPAADTTTGVAYLDAIEALLERQVRPNLLVPVYGPDALEGMLRSLMARDSIVVHQALVHDSAGQPVGWFVWLLADEDRAARVVELVAERKQELPVLTALLQDARKRGARRMIGDPHPQFLEALGRLEARFALNPRPVKVWSADTSILTAVLRGDYIWSGLPAFSVQ